MALAPHVVHARSAKISYVDAFKMMASSFKTVRLAGRRESTPGSRFRLVVISEMGPSTHSLPASGQVVLGRGEDAAIKLDDVSASRKHAVITIGASVRLEDLGSANGTVFRGQPLNGSVELRDGDSFEIGTSVLVLQRDELAGEETQPWHLLTHDAFLQEIDEAPVPFSVMRFEVQGAASRVRDALRAELTADDVAASFGPGAFEVLTRGKTPGEAKALLKRVRDRLIAAGARVKAGTAHAPDDGTEAEELLAACGPAEVSGVEGGMVVRDDAMAALYRLIDRVAPSLINVLLLGETGVGKEVLAGEIHRRSKRASAPFVRLNCAALTESLLESELFGHEKGAFTGAFARKTGLLESANGGTVLLDEIGEVPQSIQAKLLRVLEERQVLRVGAVKPEPINVRFIFATNRDLEAEVARGAFRADLFYRVNGISVVIPPLRERVSEIEPLARQFILKAAQRDSRVTPVISAAAMVALKQWAWPGNIRELRNVVERAVLLAGDEGITPQLFTLGRASTFALPVSSAAGVSLLREERDAAEKRAVLEALDAVGGNQTKAAEQLGISRRTLVNRLQEYGLTKARKKPDGLA